MREMCARAEEREDIENIDDNNNCFFFFFFFFFFLAVGKKESLVANAVGHESNKKQARMPPNPDRDYRGQIIRRRGREHFV
jgi:hypothetical protein